MMNTIRQKPIAQSVYDMKLWNKQAGKHFFSPDTMHFWNTRISNTLFHSAKGDTYFVTSEDNYDRTLRNYSVRKFVRQTSEVRTIGDFNSIANLKTALKYAALHASEGA